MDKDEIKNILNILSMITEDCPYKRGIGNEETQEGKSCDIHRDCMLCWESELSKELKRLSK